MVRKRRKTFKELLDELRGVQKFDQHSETQAEFYREWADEKNRQRQQELRDKGHAPPVKKTKTKYLRNWDAYTFDAIKPDSADRYRLNLWFASMVKGQDYSYNIFFGILAEYGFRQVDFDWNKFREDYYSTYPEKRKK